MPCDSTGFCVATTMKGAGRGRDVPSTVIDFPAPHAATTTAQKSADTLSNATVTGGGPAEVWIVNDFVAAERLATVPGIGTLIATVLSATVDDAAAFIVHPAPDDADRRKREVRMRQVMNGYLTDQWDRIKAAVNRITAAANAAKTNPNDTDMIVTLVPYEIASTIDSASVPTRKEQAEANKPPAVACPSRALMSACSGSRAPARRASKA